MSIWILKAIVQKTISFLPASQKFNYFFQKYITGGVRLTDDYLEDKLSHCRDHIHYFHKHKINSSYKVLELGTGWYPIVPIGLFLNGAEEICTVDINFLVSEDNLKECVRRMVQYEKEGKLQLFIKDVKKERLEVLHNIRNGIERLSSDEIFKLLKISPLVCDARQLVMISPQSIDLITSNNTFEHVYPHILQEILSEFKRIVRHGGVMSHFIDMSDHFAHMDKSINIYNFLKYSDSAWSFIDNSLQPQNRMRITNYRELYKRSGIEISEEVNRPGNLDELRSVKLDKKFINNSTGENAVSHSFVISKM